MDFQSQKLYSPKFNKKRLNQEQVKLLERSFSASKKLEPELKLQLANKLDVPPRQVAIWYQNKRARWKTQSLELDYSTLQVKLDNALSEKRRLEKDVKYLQEELRKAQEMMFSMNSTQRDYHHHHHHQQQNHQQQLNFVSCKSTGSSEEGGSSSFHEDHEVLQIDELYACLIGADKSTWS
ncbi:Homeobox-leucine zipper protein HAT5 [Hibiscus syriacus]|uniref:Homeobox-leucine zipper protein n=1 Tax=Hibiscus syriacus TaxID=106335 RepID=A0A6A2YP39_HIBSY|nr:homeobox-leucine zipper protein ATHB-52-like [Hibiscus syriacus]KAE8681089.1 Homeobox-leucine zipper protein HAT5 [Hibiscus syriacus]